MHFKLPGEGSLEDIEATAAVITKVLQKEGLDRISELSITFHGWRGSARCQVTDSEGWLQPVHIERVPLSEAADGGEPKLPEGLIIRDRPDDLEWSPLAVMAGRDD